MEPRLDYLPLDVEEEIRALKGNVVSESSRAIYNNGNTTFIIYIFDNPQYRNELIIEDAVVSFELSDEEDNAHDVYRSSGKICLHASVKSSLENFCSFDTRPFKIEKPNIFTFCSLYVIT